MTNYAEDILTKNEKGIYTLNMPKDVDSIKVSDFMPQEFIDGLKKRFPYETYNVEDALKGVKTLHKRPQSNADWHHYYLNESKQYKALADSKYGTYDYSGAFESLKEQIDTETKSKSKSTLLIAFECFISFGIGALIGCGIHELIKFIF